MQTRKTSRANLWITMVALILSPTWLPAQVTIADEMRDLGYSITNLGETEVQGQPCWKLQLDGIAGKNPPFPRMVMLVRQEDNYPVQVEYFNEHECIVKTLYVKAILRKNGVPATMKMTMKNHLDGTETSFDLSINYED